MTQQRERVTNPYLSANAQRCAMHCPFVLVFSPSVFWVYRYYYLLVLPRLWSGPFLQSLVVVKIVRTQSRILESLVLKLTICLRLLGWVKSCCWVKIACNKHQRIGLSHQQGVQVRSYMIAKNLLFLLAIGCRMTDDAYDYWRDRSW